MSWVACLACAYGLVCQREWIWYHILFCGILDLSVAGDPGASQHILRMLGVLGVLAASHGASGHDANLDCRLLLQD